MLSHKWYSRGQVNITDLLIIEEQSGNDTGKIGGGWEKAKRAEKRGKEKGREKEGSVSSVFLRTSVLSHVLPLGLPPGASNIAGKGWFPSALHCGTETRLDHTLQSQAHKL